MDSKTDLNELCAMLQQRIGQLETDNAILRLKLIHTEKNSNEDEEKNIEKETD